MVPKEKNQNQGSLFFSFSDTLDQRHPLYILANKIDWGVFEKAFAPLYSARMGRPAKPIRLMVGLLMLKHIRNLSDEMVVEQRIEKTVKIKFIFAKFWKGCFYLFKKYIIKSSLFF